MSRPYYKQDVGAYCHHDKCDKRRILMGGPSGVDYVIGDYTYCKDHALKICRERKLPFPGRGLWHTKINARRDVIQFLKAHLRLEFRESCPLAPFPPNKSIYLVLAGEVISEIQVE